MLLLIANMAEKEPLVFIFSSSHKDAIACFTICQKNILFRIYSAFCILNISKVWIFLLKLIGVN